MTSGSVVMDGNVSKFSLLVAVDRLRGMLKFGEKRFRTMVTQCAKFYKYHANSSLDFHRHP